MPEITCPTCGHCFTLSEGVSVSECPGCGDSLLISGGTVERAEATPLGSMWYYVDANGRQTGPVTEPRALRLVERGVIRPETLVWRQDMTDWQPLGGSPLAALAAAHAQQTLSVAYPTRSLPAGLAVGGMVTGIVGLLCSIIPCLWLLGLPLDLVSLALSGAALQQVKAGKASGRGMAIAGLTCSIIGLVILGIYLLVFGLALRSSRPNYIF